jgi:DNA repair protein RadC
MATRRAGRYRGRVQLSVSPRPVRGDVRRRLAAAGAGALDDAELLGLVLDGGVGGAAARARGAAVLAETGGLAGIAHRLRGGDAGLAPRAAAVVDAALELGRRATAVPLRPGEPVRDAAAVWAHFRGRLPQRERELFAVLLLDGKNRVRAEVAVSEGTLTAALVHPREVFRPAIRGGAAAVILVHNHPSGDATPSAEDAAITERLRQAGDLLGIRVLDHVVIGAGGYVSMADAGRW